MSGNFEALYHQSNVSLQSLQLLLSEFEKADDAGIDDANSLERQILREMDAIGDILDRLTLFVAKEPAHRRQQAKLRVDQLKYDLTHYRAALRQIQSRREMHARESRHRQELLATDFGATSGSDVTLTIDDHELKQHGALHRSHRSVDQMLDSGSAMLYSLREQRGTIDGVRRRLSNFLSTLGLSSSLMRLIERRGTQDRWILFGGIIVTTILLTFIYVYFTT